MESTSERERNGTKWGQYWAINSSALSVRRGWWWSVSDFTNFKRPVFVVKYSMFASVSLFQFIYIYCYFFQKKSNHQKKEKKKKEEKKKKQRKGFWSNLSSVDYLSREIHILPEKVVGHERIPMPAHQRCIGNVSAGTKKIKKKVKKRKEIERNWKKNQGEGKSKRKNSLDVRTSISPDWERWPSLQFLEHTRKTLERSSPRWSIVSSKRGEERRKIGQKKRKFWEKRERWKPPSVRLVVAHDTKRSQMNRAAPFDFDRSSLPNRPSLQS